MWHFPQFDGLLSWHNLSHTSSFSSLLKKPFHPKTLFIPPFSSIPIFVQFSTCQCSESIFLCYNLYLALFIVFKIKNNFPASDSCSLFSRSVVSDSLWPRGLQTTRLLCQRNAPGRNTGVSCHFLLQGISWTQGLNPCLLHCRRVLYHWVPREPPQSLPITSNTCGIQVSTDQLWFLVLVVWLLWAAALLSSESAFEEVLCTPEDPWA